MITRRGFVGTSVAAAGALGAGSLLVGCSSGETPASGAASAGLAGSGAPPSTAASSRLFTFVGGNEGKWAITRIAAVRGDTLPNASRLDVVAGAVAAPRGPSSWVLRGVTSNERYVTRSEKELLVAKQAALGRPEATLGALIPIKKSAAWWAMTQDERRAVFEERSRHVTIGLKYLPGVARRLHHCRDLGEDAPFDFVTYFDYAKADEAAFDAMLAELRATEEWKLVEREVDVRLERRSA